MTCPTETSRAPLVWCRHQPRETHHTRLGYTPRTLVAHSHLGSFIQREPLARGEMALWQVCRSLPSQHQVPSLSWDDTSSCLDLCPGLPPSPHVRSPVASLPPPCKTPWWPGPKGWTLWHRRCHRSHCSNQSRNSLRMPSRHGGPHALRRGTVADEVCSAPGPASPSHSVSKT